VRGLVLVALLAAACDRSGPGPVGDASADADAPTDAATDGDAGEPSALEEQFEEVWRTFDETYPYFVHKGVDWDALGEAHRGLVGPETTYEEWVGVVASMLEPLHDNHVTLVTTGGDTVTPGHVGWTANFDDGLVDAAYLDAPVVAGALTHGWLSGNVGYARFTSWMDEGAVEAFHEAMETYASADAFVIDVRNNSGGSEPLAVEVAGRFASGTVLYGHHRYRDGPEWDDFGELRDRTFGPTGPWQFEGPVAVLTGSRCMSSNEAFVAAMRELPQVVTVGSTTRGSTGNPTSVDLADGTVLVLSTWIAYLPDMTVIEDSGIPPDEPAEFGVGDGVLDRAMEILAGP
jgi:carboxyl-terminal processing protease